MINDNNKTLDVLLRGVDTVIEKEKLEQKLLSGKKLRIKFGIDPTSPNIHIGRAVPLLKLRDFQQMGHKIVIIIGDFTGVIGDTSDKDSERPMLTEDQVKKNLESYTKQAAKVIDIDLCEVHYNSEWLSKLSYNEICHQANAFSLSDFISRENIKKRLDSGKRVSLRELMYPLMQGYDSVAIKADLEIGGTDQIFNLLAGRELQRLYKQEAQDILTNPLLEGLDGRKMSSSWGNVINLFDAPFDMYGKVMSLNDQLIIKYFILTTRVDMQLIRKYEEQLAKSEINPRDIKMKLAFELVRFYHSEEDAKKAEENFITVFSKKEIPTDIQTLKPSQYDILTVLVEGKMAASRGEARRAIEQKGVSINDSDVTSDKQEVKAGDIVKKGKRYFVKII